MKGRRLQRIHQHRGNQVALAQVHLIVCYGTAENFEQYRIDKLLEKNAQALGMEKRLILTGYGNFRAEHETTHALMEKLKITHLYRDGPARKHDWQSG